MAFNVFTSYSTRDLTPTKQVKRLLEGAGAQVFGAEYSVAPGSDLARKIITAIRYCDLFVLLWSHHAKNSEWVPQEIGIAKGCGRPVIPVVLHRSADVPGFLKELKYLPLYRDPEKNGPHVVAKKRRNAGVRKKQKMRGLGLVSQAFYCGCLHKTNGNTAPNKVLRPTWCR